MIKNVRNTLSPAFNTVKMAWVAGLGKTARRDPGKRARVQERSFRHVPALPRHIDTIAAAGDLGGEAT